MSFGDLDCHLEFSRESAIMEINRRTPNVSNMSFVQGKASNFCCDQMTSSISIDQQCEHESGELRSETREEFFGEIPEASSSSVDAREKACQNVVPSHGRDASGDDNILRFQFMYDGQQPRAQLPDDKNNNEMACSDGVSTKFYSTSHSTALSHAAFYSHSSKLHDEFAATALHESLNQDCRVMEDYFESLQQIRCAGDSVNGGSKNGSKTLSDSSMKIFHAEKRLRDSTYVCNRAEDHHRTYGKQVVYDGSFIDSDRNPIQALRLSKSRGVDKNADEAEGEKNGEGSHSRVDSGGGSVVDEAEILHPQANFQQRGFILKHRAVENTNDSDLGQVNSMLISHGDNGATCSADIDLSRELENAGGDQVDSRSESSLKSFLPSDFMSPNHQTEAVRRSTSQADFRERVQSVTSIVDLNVSPNGSLNSDDNTHQNHDQMEGMESEKDNINEKLRSKSKPRNNGRFSSESPESDGRKSRESDCSSATHQNGESPEAHEDKDANSFGKHIYPWMKETRQNTRRKQTTSSNSSGNGDKSSKRERTAYTNSQLVELEKEFHFNRYLCRPRRIEMAQMLNLTERQIKIWFQNRRMKFKKDQKLKAMPMTPIGREFYHQHHHTPNVNSDTIFSRNNDHRHYHQSGHVHSAEGSRRQILADGCNSAHGALDCSTSGRCYHGHRHHGSHTSQDPSIMVQQPLARSASNAYDGSNKSYSNQKVSGGRLASPSSSSSAGTMSPSNGRSSGGFGSDIPMRSASNGSESQTMLQSNCGFLPHGVPTNVAANGIDDETPVVLEKNSTIADGRHLLTRHGYDMPSFAGHGISPFQRRMDDLASRMHFGDNGAGIGQQISAMSSHYFGGYDRPKESSTLSMIPDAVNTTQHHAMTNTRYPQFHNPLESLTDCVQRSRDFRNQTLNGSRYPSTDSYSTSFSAGGASNFGRSRYERSMETSPLDFSRSKSISPRAQRSEVYLNNRLTHL